MPGHQLQMIQDVASNVPAGTPVILYIFTCGPVDITWAQNSDNIHAIVQGFYPAQSTGDAVADILFGNTDAGGRLPVTWPQSMEQVRFSYDTVLNVELFLLNMLYGMLLVEKFQVPAMSNYTMKGRTYRYWFADKTHSSPLYPFGYGLSYASWEYQSLSLSTNRASPCDSINGTVSVKNVGSVAGDEVPQIYIRWSDTTLPMPDLQLVNFTRFVNVQPGSSRTFEFSIEPKMLSFYGNVSESSPAGKDYGGYWETSNGTITLFAGGQQPDFNNFVKPRVPSNILEKTVDIVGNRRPLSQCYQ